MKTLLILMALSSVFLLVSCSYIDAEPYPAKELTLQYVLDAAKARRESIIKPDYNIFRSLADERVRLGEKWAEQYGEDYLLQLVVQSMVPGVQSQRISYYEAIADAETLLWLLRLTYGAYTYYGGDDVFVPLFNRIFEAFAEQDQWDAGDYGDFAEVLHRHLFEVVVDNHVHIGNRVLGAPDTWALSPLGVTEMPLGITADFFVGTTSFERSENGFRCYATSLYVTSIPERDIEEVFRLTIDDFGKLAYKPVIVIPGRSGLLSYSLTVTYEIGELEELLLLRHDSNQRRTVEQPSLVRRFGIPVVRIMRMGFYPNGADARQFLAYAEELQNEPVVIIDLRSNMGGNNLLSAQFLHRLTGEIIPSNSVILNIGNHQQSMEGLAAAMPSYHPLYRPIEDFKVYHPTTPLGEGHFVWNYTADRLVPNEQLIVFLTDRYTMSAGEGFIDFSLNLQNSLVIGQNTGGVFRKTGGPAYFLPNSGIMVGFGSGIVFHPDNQFPEGIGFAPDIWAIGDALDAALTLLLHTR